MNNFYDKFISMINTVTQQPIHTKPNRRYQNIKYSGYVGLCSIGVCALTGFKQVKFPHKMKIHKASAIITAISSLWHLGAIKKWDRFFTSQVRE